jgi:transposase-like protein
MSVKAQIIELFERLAEPERNLLLQELNRKVVSNTILIEDASILSCPHCNSKLFVKNGKRDDLQKYKCKSCCKVFTIKTGTPFHKIKKLDKFEAYKALMMESYLPIKKIAAKIGISIQTAFDWRHKILSGMSKEVTQFEGITEIDDIWFLYSQKGRKGLEYSRKRGGSHRAGDNDYQAKLLITSDRKSHTDLSVVRIGRLNKSDIQRKISGKFYQDCILISDKHRSIASFANSEGIKHVSFKANEHSAGGEYHVQNVNNMASRLKGIINHSLRGVSTKYLQGYANWVHLTSCKPTSTEMNRMMTKNKKVWDMHKNREGIYKWFIENFSRRTYRCPVKRSFASELAPDLIPSICNI